MKKQITTNSNNSSTESTNHANSDTNILNGTSPFTGSITFQSNAIVNNSLGIGTNSPQFPLQAKGGITTQKFFTMQSGLALRMPTIILATG